MTAPEIPKPLAEVWPPDFAAEEKRRSLTRRVIRSTPDPRSTADIVYSDDCERFIRDCCVTYDPRNASRGLPVKVPFIPFRKQRDLIAFILGLADAEKDGLIEKSRDMGATWICCAISVWLWRYKGAAVGWGSRKEQLVDKLGDPDSIFEKIRMIIRELPDYCLPTDFNPKKHLAYMKCVNPETDATITGEAGDNIGRGGRSTIYFKDESAHYEHPESIEAALGDNTNVQIDLSSVFGEGTVFHRKRMSGTVGVFILDWRDHPGKSQAWYDARRDKAERQGLLHLFSQEVDRDYAAAVPDVFIPPEWVRACIDAHIKLGIEPVGRRRIGLDVADEGGDANALVDMYGVIVMDIDQWYDGDTGVTGTRAWNYCIENGVREYVYDIIGVGAGVKTKTNELLAMDVYKPLHMDVWGFVAGPGVTDPEDFYVEDRKNRDMFANAKAQAFWDVRQRCHETYRAIVQGKEYDPERLLCIPSELKYSQELVSEMSRPKRVWDESGRIMVEKKKDLKKRGIPSPNLLEALYIAHAARQDDNTGMAGLLKAAMGID